MAKHYVTLGQIHIHRINGKVLDKDCVVRFDADNANHGRQKALEYFGQDFFTDYHENVWDENKLKFFPRGYIDL